MLMNDIPDRNVTQEGKQKNKPSGVCLAGFICSAVFFICSKSYGTA